MHACLKQESGKCLAAVGLMVASLPGVPLFLRYPAGALGLKRRRAQRTVPPEKMP
jgi:hypothetical protein